MSFLVNKIKDWRLKRKIPKYSGGEFRYDGDGITKISVINSEEVEKYNFARKRAEID